MQKSFVICHKNGMKSIYFQNRVEKTQLSGELLDLDGFLGFDHDQTQDVFLWQMLSGGY